MQPIPSEPHKNKPRKKKFFAILGLLLIIAGIAVIAYPLSTFVVTNRAQDQLRSDWDKKVKEASEGLLANKTGENETANEEKKPAASQKVPTGKAAFKLIIPKIDLDMIVVEGTDTASLKLGPGHISKTVQPGEPGVCVISGHRTTYGAPFFRLDKVEKGDDIIVETSISRYSYKVFDIRVVDPHDTSFIKPLEESVVALTTCTPIHSARERLVVLASIVH